MSASNFEELKKHFGHKLSCVFYGPDHAYEYDPANVAIECETCGEVLLDFDKPEPGADSIEWDDKLTDTCGNCGEVDMKPMPHICGICAEHFGIEIDRG